MLQKVDQKMLGKSTMRGVDHALELVGMVAPVVKHAVDLSFELLPRDQFRPFVGLKNVFQKFDQQSWHSPLV